MKIVNILSTILIMVLFYSTYITAQQQIKIHWPSLADSPWPVIRGDMQGTGRSEFIGPSTNNVIWRKDMPLGIYHGPVIGYNDDIFVGTRSYTSSLGVNYFYSMDKNGENIWTFVTNDPRANVAGPTIANDGTIYFSSIGKGLFALNPDGTLKWNNPKFAHTYYTRYIPLDKNGNIYLTWIDTIFVLEPANGNIIRSIYTPNIIDSDIAFSIEGDTIYYKSQNYLNARTIYGDSLWSSEFNIDVLVDASLTVDNSNHIYLCIKYNYLEYYLYCINPDGTVNWKFKIDDEEVFSNHAAPTIDKNGNIIFPTYSYNKDGGYIYSVDYYGNLNWKTRLGQLFVDGAWINHGLVCDANGKTYCGSTDGDSTYFWCLNYDGKILWRLNLEGYEYDTSPAISSDGTIYIGTHRHSTFLDHIRNLIAVRDTVTSVNEENQQPISFKLEQNFPNPFNPSTNIRYSIEKPGRVTLKVYDLMGKEISTLLDRYQESGSYDILFQPDNLSSGVYFYRLTSGNYSVTKKLTLLK